MIEPNIKPLGEVCDFFNGKAHEKAISEDGQYKVVNSKFISSEGNEFKLTNNQNFPLYKGDICLVMSDVPNGKTLAKCFLVDADNTYSLNQRICAIRTDKFDLKFLYYQLNRHPFLLSFNNGENQTNLRKADILNCPLWIPSISEQKHIVSMLDQTFADIEQARDKTERNLKNVRELFESYLHQLFSQRGDDWVEYTMSDLCEITSKLVDPKEEQYLDFQHIGAGNMVSTTGELIDVKTAREEGLISGKFVFDKSMVLYSKIRPYLMKVCRPDFIGLCSADVYPLSPIVEKLDRNYLFYLLLSKDFTDYAISGSGRAGMPKVNRTHLFKYSVSVPSLNKQREYAKKIDRIASQTKILEKVYSTKLCKLEELKNSILKKALSGGLSNNPSKGANA